MRVKNGAGDKCIKLFPKYWNMGPFLMGNRLCIYKRGALSQEEMKLKILLTNFVKNLGYFRGAIPRDEAS